MKLLLELYYISVVVSFTLALFAQWTESKSNNVRSLKEVYPVQCLCLFLFIAVVPVWNIAMIICALQEFVRYAKSRKASTNNSEQV